MLLLCHENHEMHIKLHSISNNFQENTVRMSFFVLFFRTLPSFSDRTFANLITNVTNNISAIYLNTFSTMDFDETSSVPR